MPVHCDETIFFRVGTIPRAQSSLSCSLHYQWMMTHEYFLFLKSIISWSIRTSTQETCRQEVPSQKINKERNPMLLSFHLKTEYLPQAEYLPSKNRVSPLAKINRVSNFATKQLTPKHRKWVLLSTSVWLSQCTVRPNPLNSNNGA